MLIGFARYSQDRSFAVLGRNRLFALTMALASILGAFIGGRLLGLVPSFVLLPLLAAILLIWCRGGNLDHTLAVANSGLTVAGVGH